VGKLIVVVARFLSLCVVLLAIPAIVAAQFTPLADLSPTANSIQLRGLGTWKAGLF
jgi:hypothetical protein